MWPLLKKRNRGAYSVPEKVLWSSWYLVNLTWVVLVLYRIYAAVRPGEDFFEVTTRGKSFPVWETAFPAVTICSQLKIHPERFDFRAHVYNKSNLDRASYETLQDASLLCNKLLMIQNRSDAAAEGKDYISENFHDFMKEVGHNFDDMFYSCSWANKRVNCSDIFGEVITDHGICYTFNGVDIWRYGSYFDNPGPTDDWDVSNGYTEEAKYDAYPRRSVPGGVKGGLQVLLATEVDKHESLCTGPSLGFKVQLHNPAEAPYFETGFFIVPPDQEVALAVEPERIKSDLEYSLKSIFKQCYDNSDGVLQNFKTYTYKNCVYECLANHTMKKCNCFGFYMPRNKTAPVCGAQKLVCLSNATVEFSRGLMSIEYRGEEYDWTCDCNQDCSIDRYKTEYSYGDFHWENIDEANIRPNVSKQKKYSISRLTVYTKDLWYVDEHYHENILGPFDIWLNLAIVTTGLTFIMMTAVIYFISTSSRAEDDRSPKTATAPTTGKLTRDTNIQEWRTMKSREPRQIRNGNILGFFSFNSY